MLTQREQLIMIEIGSDSIGSASSFVEYMSDSYSISRSSVWYILKRLKDKRLLYFATREDPGRSLELTKEGMERLRLVERSKSEILNYFAKESAVGIGALHRLRVTR
jgi:DNA-binding PadR family transcriptional regulator